MRLRLAQSGAAVITALLVISLAALLASGLLLRINEWIEAQSLQKDRAQALELARGGLDYARAILLEDNRRSNIETLDEDWSRQLPPVSIEGGELGGYIEDLQGRFNLNNLGNNGDIDPAELAIYQSLLSSAGLPGALADSLADWLDSDEKPRPGGAESAWYSSQSNPCPAANEALNEFAELALVKDYDEASRQRLRPLVAVLPGKQPINVNTAPTEVLAALVPGLNLSGARQLVQARRQAAFRDPTDFRRRLPNPETMVPRTTISTVSRHFLATLSARYGQARVTLICHLVRDADGAKPRILWQSLQ